MSPSQPIWKKLFAILSAIGILLSISNEFASINPFMPGVALITRPLHALLGVLALLWVLFRLRSGAIALVLWIVLAIPIIGVDRSQDFVESVFMIDIRKTSQSTVTYSNNLPEITAYSARGINFAPLLVAAWFWFGSYVSAFPLFGWRPSVGIRRKALAGSMVLAVVVLVGISKFNQWIRSAPYVLVAAEPRMEFYHGEQKLGSYFVRITPELMNQLGLDGDQPPEEWIIFQGDPSPWGFAIFLDDGTRAKYDRVPITVASSQQDRDLVRQDTPWGERIQPRRASTGKQEGRFRFYGLARNRAFAVRPESPATQLSPGQTFLLPITIEAKEGLPVFEKLRFTTVAYAYRKAEGDFPQRERDAVAPATFKALNRKSIVRGAVPVQAPFRPGVYSLLLNGWLYDSEGQRAEPIRTLGYSSYALIEVRAEEAEVSGTTPVTQHRASAATP